MASHENNRRMTNIMQQQSSLTRIKTINTQPTAVIIELFMFIASAFIPAFLQWIYYELDDVKFYSRSDNCKQMLMLILTDFVSHDSVVNGFVSCCVISILFKACVCVFARAQCAHCLFVLVENADLLLINPVVMLIFMIFPSALITHLFLCTFHAFFFVLYPFFLLTSPMN